MKIAQDDVYDIDRYNPAPDYGFREYAILLTRVQAAANHVDITSVAERLTKFVQDESVNPVYAETLVNLLMAKAIKVMGVIAQVADSPAYDLMAVRVITRHVGVTVDVWQRTMESNNSQAPEG